MLKKKITDYQFPQDLKDMSDRELDLLSYEIRDFLIENVSKTGGHLASNLGVVELTIALHRVLKALETRFFGMWGISPIFIKS